jgi:hypothetical protein
MEDKPPPIHSDPAAFGGRVDTTSLFHTIRFTQKNSWQPWGDVEGAAGRFNFIGPIGCANSRGDLHVLVRAGGFALETSLHHAIRHTDAFSWQRFHNVEETAAGSLAPFRATGIGATDFSGDLHVVVGVSHGAVPSPNSVHHTIRFEREQTWQPFADITCGSRIPHSLAEPRLRQRCVAPDV